MAALESLRKFVVPRAAQTWEIAVHTPDLLAASYGVRAYLEGYPLTGNEEYLDLAVYWARACLPFVYPWQHSSNAWMLYGTIPVFGATNFQAPVWFGRIVQWNGLHMAYSPMQLAPYDASFDWDALGLGIPACGMHQQETSPNRLGTYRDVFDTLNGTRYGPLIAPNLFMGGILTQLGLDPRPRTLVKEVGGTTVRVSSRGVVSEAPGALTFSVAHPPGETTFTLAAGVTRPSRVTRNGDELPYADDLGSAAEGWRHDFVSGMATVKLGQTDTTPIATSLEGASPGTTELIPEERTDIRFLFEEEGNPEGWAPNQGSLMLA